MEHLEIANIVHSLLERRDDLDTTLAPGQIALRGDMLGSKTPAGVGVTIDNTIAEATFETRMTRPANVLLHLVLEGSVSFSLNGEACSFGRSKGAPAQLIFSATSCSTEFRRRFSAGQRLRKISVAISWDWLRQHGVSVEDILAGKVHRCERWAVPHPDVTHALEMLTPVPCGSRVTARMFELEALALSLLRFTMKALLSDGPQLSRAERERLANMESFACAPGRLPELRAIARAGGVSISTMRRIFERAYGQSVKARVRELRLDQAASALLSGATVTEATRIAGFETPTSFATAFRKVKGTPPSHYRRASGS